MSEQGNEPTIAGDGSLHVDMVVRTRTLERLYEVAKKIGTFSENKPICDDETLQALLMMQELWEKVERDVIASIRARIESRQRATHVESEAVDQGSIEDELLDDLEDEEDLENLDEEDEDTLSPEELAEAEKNDKELSELLDTCEQHPYAVSLYMYQRLTELLEPVAQEFGTTAPVETVKALLEAYRSK
jgi:hypothetical protein